MKPVELNGKVQIKVLRGATVDLVESISQRELRNDSAQILRRVEAGESLLVTRRGVPVAQIGPVRGIDLDSRSPARRRRYSDVPRVRSTLATAEILEDLRGER